MVILTLLLLLLLFYTFIILFLKQKYQGFPVVRETSLRNNDENDDQNRRVCVGLILRSQLIRALQCDELMFSLEQAEQIKHQEPIIPKSLHLEGKARVFPKL